MLFRKKIDRYCTYCQFAGKIDDETMVCQFCGIVPSDHRCRRFQKRVAEMAHDELGFGVVGGHLVQGQGVAVF